MTFPGSAVSMIASGDKAIAEIKSLLRLQIFSHDKINQLRHVKYLKSVENIERHMEEVASLIRPKFDYLDGALKNLISYEDLLTWYKPDGGYFITVDTYPGAAKRTLQLVENMGVTVATAGSTYPYGKDPNDSNIRLAPTHATLEELEQAIPLFCICVQMAGIEKILEKRATSEGNKGSGA